MRHVDVYHTCKSSMQQSSRQRREEGMEMLSNEQLRITGSVVDGPAWLDVKIMQDVKKAAAGISCTRSCASIISGSATAGDSRVQATCRSMAAVKLLTGWAAAESLTSQQREEDESTSTVGRGDAYVRRGNGARSQQRVRDSMTYVGHGGSRPSWTRRAAKRSPRRRGNSGGRRFPLSARFKARRRAS